MASIVVKVKQILSSTRQLPLVKQIIDFATRVKLPGFEGLPLFDVGVFFFRRFKEGELQTRARSLSFSFFLALFPAIIFLFTLIPYIPLENFQDTLLEMIKAFLPANTYEAAHTTIEDIIRHQRSGLLSFGFFLALFISAEGVLELMRWFNKSFHGKMIRSNFKQRLVAIFLTISLASLVILAIGLIISGEVLSYYLVQKTLIKNNFNIVLLQIGKWIILLALCFTAISLLYFAGPSHRQQLRFITAGSSLATLLIVLTSIGFNFYITHFAGYNKVYGSIGTLMIILVWLYFNSLVLLIGFELNVAIHRAKTHQGEILKKKILH